MPKIIRIDNCLPLIDCPHYCRDNKDRIRWLALKMGYINVIRPADEVRFLPEYNYFVLTVEE